MHVDVQVKRCQVPRDGTFSSEGEEGEGSWGRVTRYIHYEGAERQCTHTCNHNILTHIHAGEKYINICITKQYTGLSVVKYL